MSIILTFESKAKVMRVLKVGLIILTTFFVVSCGGGKKEKIVGEWKLTAFTNDGETVELTECDKKTTWNFTKESAEDLGDGTAVQQLHAIAPEECKYFGFNSKWTVKDGKLFVSTSRIGGMGGFSLAGMMEIVDLTNNKLVLNTMNKEITLEK